MITGSGSEPAVRRRSRRALWRRSRPLSLSVEQACAAVQFADAMRRRSFSNWVRSVPRKSRSRCPDEVHGQESSGLRCVGDSFFLLLCDGGVDGFVEVTDPFKPETAAIQTHAVTVPQP